VTRVNNNGTRERFIRDSHFSKRGICFAFSYRTRVLIVLLAVVVAKEEGAKKEAKKTK
jgi:hypothetical protein